MSGTTTEIYFNAREAANYIQRPYKTLERWRAERNPKLRHTSDDGKISYRKSDCDAYLIEQLRL